MPVGTANSTLKTSFSLTSLGSCPGQDSPEHGTPMRLKNERLYHSLTKKSRKSSEQDKELWRKSWGSVISQDGKEFWEGFQADYDYLMAQNILEKTVSEMSVADGRVTVTTPTAPPVWSHSEFMDHFAQLYSWLKGIQDLVYGKQENVTDWKLRAERQEDMQRQRFRLDTFNEQSQKLINRYPELEGELSWLTKHVNDKWETVEGLMGVSKKGEGKDQTTELGSLEKVEHEVKCLRRWLRELDGKLKPLNFQQGWTKAELEMKAKEHMVLHRDIEAHRKIVSSIYKLCEKADASTLLAARALERKYHEYYLRSLEWQYHIESLVDLQLNKNPPSWSNDSDGEPVAKIARFNSWKDTEKEGVGRGETEAVQDTDLTMEIASAEVNGCSDRMMYPGAREESILVSEDSSYTNPLGAKSRKFNGFSGAKHEEESKSNLTVPLPKVSDHAVQQVVSGTAEANLNHSDESARTPNTGTFHWRDYDTDSDLENAKMSEWGSNDGRSEKDGDTASSEDGWTYVAATQDEEFEPGDQIGNGDNSANKVSSREMKYFSAKSIPKSGSISTLSNREPISSIDTRLVDRADEMFRYHHKSYTGKQTTMKLPAKEGSEEKPLDSCDASGEYTEDSDERESHSSEDNEGSIATCKRSGSADGILDDTPIAKGLNESFLRNQRSTIRNRPWSMSNVSQLRNMRGSTLKTRSSRSESALNQMLGQLDKSLKNNRVPSMEDGTWGSCGSARKRRTKIRKRLFKRSNSGSDGVTQSGACTETDEESIGVGTPAFCLGPTAGIVTIAPGEREIQAYWDDYQEKYPSEAYSEEPADSETAKELLEFGEDYGKYLGNKSDCSSKWSRPPRKNRHNRQRIDSTSDFNEVKRFLRQSKDQLGLVEMKLKESSNGYSCATELNGQELIPNSFLDEIIETCKRNVNSLTTLLNEVNDEMHVQREKNYIQIIKENWEGLKTTAEIQKAKQLKNEMNALKTELLNWAASIESMETTVTSREELKAKIIQIKDELNSMEKGKSKLLQANVSVHRFLSIAKNAEPTLRDEVIELYRVWDQTFSRVTTCLFNLQSLSQAWDDFDDHLSQLQCALRTDTLKVIDFALQCGTSSEVTGSLRGIAGLLSEKDSTSKDSVTIRDESITGVDCRPLLTALNTEGSLSDSGISDSGSEQELSDREKRLVQLKRLAKRLESILSPSSQALTNMFKRIEETESGLRELQKTCRDLIVRSSSAEEFKMIVSKSSSLEALDGALGTSYPSGKASSVTKRNRSKGLHKVPEISRGEIDSVDDKEEDKSSRKSWLWRLVRFALPFQLALVALLCVACLMEPRCCDSLNNLDLSLYPQVRYASGPPPV